MEELVVGPVWVRLLCRCLFVVMFGGRSCEERMTTCRQKPELQCVCWIVEGTNAMMPTLCRVKNTSTVQTPRLQLYQRIITLILVAYPYSIHPSIFFRCTRSGGSRLSRVFQTYLSPAELSSSSWGSRCPPRQDGICSPSSGFWVHLFWLPVNFRIQKCWTV